MTLHIWALSAKGLWGVAAELLGRSLPGKAVRNVLGEETRRGCGGAVVGGADGQGGV